MRICGPTTQVPTSVHFWADAHGCRDREGELERERGGQGRGGGLPPFTLPSFILVIKPPQDNSRAALLLVAKKHPRVLLFCNIQYSEWMEVFCSVGDVLGSANYLYSQAT